MEDKGKKKILLVDDDQFLLKVAQNILESNYNVVCAKSGREAVNILVHGSPPSLILLDIVMPDMDGWETFRRLKAVSLLEDIPIAFLTSISGDKEEKRAFEMGAVDFIKKPYQKDQLLERVGTILSKPKAA